MPDKPADRPRSMQPCKINEATRRRCEQACREKASQLSFGELSRLKGVIAASVAGEHVLNSELDYAVGVLGRFPDIKGQ